MVGCCALLHFFSLAQLTPLALLLPTVESLTFLFGGFPRFHAFCRCGGTPLARCIIAMFRGWAADVSLKAIGRPMQLLHFLFSPFEGICCLGVACVSCVYCGLVDSGVPRQWAFMRVAALCRGCSGSSR